MAEVKPKLRVDVNHNPTKKGVKVQFVLPQAVEGDKKAEVAQKLQSKLNQGLEQYNLTVSQDTDVPYANVIGFLISINDIRLLIKNALKGASAAPAPAPAPAPARGPGPPGRRLPPAAAPSHTASAGRPRAPTSDAPLRPRRR